MIKILILSGLVLLAATYSSCSEGKNPYSPENNIIHDNIDSLKTDMVTYIGKRPRGALQGDRHRPEFRTWFSEMAQQYELMYYYVDENNLHYFYMIRPARNHTGNVNRGIGGMFETDSDLVITRFFEIFNTPIKPLDALREIGLSLFEEMIKTGNVEKWIGNKEYIEWPGIGSRYDETINEWVFN
jgi:hypothetical protein